jgi:hypothetical protein
MSGLQVRMKFDCPFDGPSPVHASISDSEIKKLNGDLYSRLCHIRFRTDDSGGFAKQGSSGLRVSLAGWRTVYVRKRQ